MKIVVPISRVDVHRLDNWIEAVKKFAGLETHSILFVPTLTVAGKAYEAAGKLSEVCKDIRVSPLDMDSDFGWPKASNWQWWSAVQIMEGLSAPWFWMELDCLPVRAGWATEIAAAYTSTGSVFMGCVVKTPWKNEQGQMVESLEGPDDKMMCGCGIYPSNLNARLKEIGQTGIMQDFTKGEASTELPWDLYLRHTMRKLGIGHTDVIGDYWNTQNYRLEGNTLKCDPRETHEAGNRASVKRAGVVNPAAAVIHGCKDDSLFALVMAGLDTRTLTPLPTVITAEKAKMDWEHNPEVEALKAQLQAQELRFASLEALLIKTLSAPVETKKIPEFPPTHVPYGTITPIGTPAQPVGGWPEPEKTHGWVDEADLEKEIIAAIKSKKSIRASEISSITGIPLNKLKAMSELPDSPFSIAAKAGWVHLNKKKPATT